MITVKNFLSTMLAIIIVFSSISAYGYDEDELQRAFNDAAALPEQLDYTFDVDYRYVGGEPYGVDREIATMYVARALGIDKFDSGIYSGERYYRSMWYTDPSFDDTNLFSTYPLLCYELGIVYGDGNNRFRPFNKITSEEAVGIVMRCIGYHGERDLALLYEEAKRIGIVKPEDRYYDTPDDLILIEEFKILMYRMRQYGNVILPLTQRLTDTYIEDAETGVLTIYASGSLTGIGDKTIEEEDIESIWRNKPLRRGFLFSELQSYYTFDQMSKDEVIAILGDYKMTCDEEKISYETYVLEERINTKEENVSVYNNSAVEFELDAEGKVIGEPKLVRGSGGFIQSGENSTLETILFD